MTEVCRRTGSDLATILPPVREPHHALDGCGVFAWRSRPVSLAWITAGRKPGFRLNRREENRDD